MRPLFTVHAGEYLVGGYIEHNFSRWNVWVPSKDTGVDLLVTDARHRKAIADQELIALDRFTDKDRDCTVFLNAWDQVATRMR